MHTVGRIRIAVCGTGFWAEQVHLPVLAAVDRFKLTGVFGRNEGRSEELAKRHGVKAFALFDDMLAAVDAVSFALPPELQAELAVRAAKAGKAVLLEKPAATSLREADKLVETVEGQGVAAMVYLPRLFSGPILDLIGQAIELGASEGKASFRSGALLPGSPYAGSVWRQDEFGALWDVGPHALSVLVSVFGPVRSVNASNPRESVFECTFEHHSGARSSAYLNLKDESIDGFCEQYSFTGNGKYIESAGLAHDRIAFFTKAAEIFADRIGEGRSDLRFARDMVAVLEAAGQSAASGMPCSIAC
jgi:predicted dehydrogenase